MERYESYKDSGIEWIGDYPSSWSLVNLSSLVDQRKNKNFDLSEDNVLSLSYGQIKKRARDNSGLLPESFDTYNIIENGDIVLRLTDLQNDKVSLRVGRSGERGIITSAYTTLAPRVVSKYLFYMLAAFDYWKGFYGLAGGVRQSLNYDGIKNLRFLLPSQPEQMAIADYLDQKTAEIDSLIEQTERSIELLEEYRKSVISEAVTKGLDPDAPMKDSGIEWIGEIPEHWDVCGLTRHIERIVDYRGKTPEKVDGGTFLITAKNIKNGTIDYAASQEYVNEDDFEDIMSRGKLRKGDVLFTTEAPLGEAAIVDDESCAAAQRIIKFECDRNSLHSKYLVYWIMSNGFQDDLATFATGSTAKGIKASKLTQLKCLIPPIAEQVQIAKALDKTTHFIGQIGTEKRELIISLSAFRKSLISEAVTGKFRVPGVE